MKTLVVAKARSLQFGAQCHDSDERVVAPFTNLCGFRTDRVVVRLAKHEIHDVVGLTYWFRDVVIPRGTQGCTFVMPDWFLAELLVAPR